MSATVAVQRSTALLDHRPPLPGDFCGILPGLEAPVMDRPSWPDHVAEAVIKPAPPGPYGHRIDRGQGSRQRQPQEGAASLRVTLTQEERAWLGKAVRWSGAAWQVWSLAPTRGHVWLVSDGQAKMAPTLELVVVR